MVFIGIVNEGTFQQVYPQVAKSTSLRLTSANIQDTLPPENGELNLIEYQGNTIAVSGKLHQGWIYSASVVDTGEPIVNALIKKVFELE